MVKFNSIKNTYGGLEILTILTMAHNFAAFAKVFVKIISLVTNINCLDPVQIFNGNLFHNVKGVTIKGWHSKYKDRLGSENMDV